MMTMKQVVRLQAGQVALPNEVLEALGIRSGDFVVLYQMGEEIQMRRYKPSHDHVALGI